MLELHLKLMSNEVHLSTYPPIHLSTYPATQSGLFLGALKRPLPTDCIETSAQSPLQPFISIVGRILTYALQVMMEEALRAYTVEEATR